MDGGLSADAPLDYASFQTWPTENRYEAFVCYNDKEEKLASGLLEQLKLHLPQLKDLQYEEPGDHLELQLPESLKGSTWFNKYTLSRFLHIVGVPELLKNANAIRVEMSQLEEARKFHLALYTQGHQDENQSDERVSHDSKDMELNTKPELQISSADHTKNELLRAIDLRLAVLKEELIAAFRQVIDDASSCKQIADLVAFCQHFGAEDLSNSLSKYLELSQEKQNIDLQNEQPKVSGNGDEKMKEPPVVKPIQYGASPAKAAQVERHSSTESEDSSNSGAEDAQITERSRSLVRSASPRRSASPMRRVQIGRSGSRRAPALTIKSLSYIPAKERVFSSKDAGNSSDEESVQPQKISVKDAINLFERKQRDQSSDLQNKKSSGDASLNTSKSVLRRWSAGMGDSSTQSLSADSCESYNDTKYGEKIQKPRVEVKAESDWTSENTSLVKTDENAALKEEENTSFSTKNVTDDAFVQPAENNTKVTASADWTKQKQDELNLMMMKMMESKPNRTRTAGAGVSRSQELPRGGQRGGFYDHYKQKRDEKLRGDNSGKRTEKEEKFKTLEVILKQKKVEMSSKATSVAEKPRKSQKNLSPSLQPKKEPSKGSSPLQPKKDSSRPAVPKKASPKASPLPATRKSWPSAPSPKTCAITPNKTPNSVSSAGTAPARRKSHPVPSPVQRGPKVEKLQQKPKSTTRTQIENKPGLKGQQPIKKTTNVSDAKVQASEDGSGVAPAKPSFYNKVTKKGSVVPLESKPFLRKRSGAGPGVAPGKAKVPPSDEPSSGGNFTAVKESIADISDQISPTEEEDPKEEANLTSVGSDVASLQQNSPVNSHPKCEEDDQFVHESDNCSKRTTDSPDIQPESVISPTAWVEIEEHQEPSDSLPIQTADTTNAEPITLSTSPRVRHSLSQMLQEDNGEPEIIEWGNAENPPAIVYQKDVSKGLKRLLKFARKSKGDANTTGWSSPSVFSDGEEDAEEPKAASKRHADAILRKAPFQAKGFGQPRTSSGANYDGGNSSKGTDYATTYDLPPGQSNLSRLASHASEKLQEGHIPSAAASSTKSRSFFSLSTFRSSKSNETKPR